MRPMTTLELDDIDVLQILDALTDRAEAWEKTEAALSDESDSDDIFFVPEECSDPTEAAKIAKHFRDIISTIELQLQEQKQEV